MTRSTSNYGINRTPPLWGQLSILWLSAIPVKATDCLNPGRWSADSNDINKTTQARTLQWIKVLRHTDTGEKKFMIDSRLVTCCSGCTPGVGGIGSTWNLERFPPICKIYITDYRHCLVGWMRPRVRKAL